MSGRGGPSHLDSFDPKPQAPLEFRGEFRSIHTKLPGVQLCEHLPKLTACADWFVVLRGVSRSLTEHRMGIKYLHTGNRPLSSLEFPGYGAVVSRKLPGRRDMPPVVAIPKNAANARRVGRAVRTLQHAGRAARVRRSRCAASPWAGA